MWHPSSWQTYFKQQLPNYKNKGLVNKVTQFIKNQPALVSYQSVNLLKQQLAFAQWEQAIILQLGDCAESFSACNSYSHLNNFYKFITSLSSNIKDNLNLPVINIGRIAGQFAKPRSSEKEANGILQYKGAIINGFYPHKLVREPNPIRMKLAYQASKQASWYLRQIMQKKCNHSELSQGSSAINNFRVFKSHESLLLPYEQALTRKVLGKGYYNLGAHMLWLGARTAKLNSAHVEYLSGINNPIGIKLNEDLTTQELVEIIKKLNKANQSGKIVVIIRLHNSNIKELLPKYITCIKENNLAVIYMCDPMHAHTYQQNGYKVRSVSDIVDNIIAFKQILEQFNITAVNLHLEATYLPVTECLGGKKFPVTINSLPNNYCTTCDPRLNGEQTQAIINDLLNNSL